MRRDGAGTCRPGRRRCRPSWPSRGQGGRRRARALLDIAKPPPRRPASGRETDRLDGPVSPAGRRGPGGAHLGRVSERPDRMDNRSGSRGNARADGHRGRSGRSWARVAVTGRSIRAHIDRPGLGAGLHRPLERRSRRGRPCSGGGRIRCTAEPTASPQPIGRLRLEVRPSPESGSVRRSPAMPHPGTEAGIRTRMTFRPADFESAASAVPPPRHGRPGALLTMRPGPAAMVPRARGPTGRSFARVSPSPRTAPRPAPRPSSRLPSGSRSSRTCPA